MARNQKTWGYVLEGPGRPERLKQLEAMSIHGVDVSKYGTLWSDKIARGRRGPNAGRNQLVGRNDLLLAAQPGDKLVVADTYCLGISPDDVAWFLCALAERNVGLLVSGIAHIVEPGQDASDLVADIGRRQNAANVAACRARQQSKARELNKSN